MTGFQGHLPGAANGESRDATAVRVDSVDVRLMPTWLEQGLAITGFELSGRRLLPVVRVGAVGIHGYGESPPLPTFTGLTAEDTADGVRECAEALIGRRLDEAVRQLHEESASLPAPVRCCLDLALHDLAARLAGVPLYRRLGTRTVAAVRISRAIGFHDLDATVKLARRYRTLGIQALKLKVGREPSMDADVVRAVRTAVGDDVEIALDANEAFDADAAASLIEALVGVGVAYFEQPVPRDDIAGLRQVRERGVPVMADESVFDAADVHHLADAKAVDLIGLKLIKSGGLTPAIDVARAARERGLGVVVIDPLGSAISLEAGLALAATLPGPERAHGLSAGLDVTAPYAQHAELVAGRIAPRDGPGLGFEVAWSTEREVV